MERKNSMRILVDTNILVSAILFPNSKPSRAINYISWNHKMVLCKQNILELFRILKEKAPKFLPNAKVLLAELSFELIRDSDNTKKFIRDPKDQPILNAAIEYDVDIILTGDKDFLSLKIEHPKCMSIAQFFKHEELKNNFNMPY